LLDLSSFFETFSTAFSMTTVIVAGIASLASRGELEFLGHPGG